MEQQIKQILKEEKFEGDFIILPIYSVGVKGDARSYEKVLQLNPTKKDFNWQFIEKITQRLLNEVNGINRVVINLKILIKE